MKQWNTENDTFSLYFPYSINMFKNKISAQTFSKILELEKSER